MAGAIIVIVWLFVTDRIGNAVTRNIKEKYPEKAKKYRVGLLFLLCLMYGFGIAFSLLAGGWVNGAEINVTTILAALKYALVVLAFSVVAGVLKKLLGL